MFAFSFIAGGLPPVAGGLPPAPPVAGGVRSAPLRFAACSPHVRHMFTACSPHVRRIDKTVHCIISVLYVTILIKSEREKERNLTRQPNNCPFLFGRSFSLCIVLEMLLYVRRIDKTVHCIISVLYVTILIKSEREKERNLTRQPNNCPFLFGMSFSLCIVLEMLLYVLRIDKPVHCIISVLYVTILIKRERAKERKSERAKERNLASHRDRLQGQAPRTPVAGGNPHAHLNGTVEHPGLPAPSQEASPPHPPSNRRRQAPRTPRPTAGASPCRTPLHPATELSHASTELCDTLACRHLRSIDTVYVHI